MSEEQGRGGGRGTGQRLLTIQKRRYDPMRISRAALMMVLANALAVVGLAQTAANGPAPQAAAAAASGTASGTLQAGLDTLRQTVGDLKLDKWKNGAMRSEATANVASIQRDLQETLPPLLATADAAPATVSAQLPVSRNIDALYDVLLRVYAAARVAAPADQVPALQQAMLSLEGGRRGFGEHVQEAAAGQEKQIAALQGTLKAQAAPPPCPAPPPPPAAADKKPVKKRKPAAKPVAKPPAGTTAAPATPKPSN